GAPSTGAEGAGGGAGAAGAAGADGADGADSASGADSAPSTHETTVRLEPRARTAVAMAVEGAAGEPDRDTPAGRIAFTVTAEDGVDGDGLVHELAVNKRVVLETAASYGSFDSARVNESLRFPDRIRTDAGEVSVVLTP